MEDRADAEEVMEGAPSAAAGADPDADLVSAALGLVLGCVAYVIVHAARLPVLLYMPETGDWSFTAPVEGIAMRYYGGLPYLALAFGVGWVAGRVPTLARWGSGRAAGVVAKVAVITLAASLGYFAIFELSHWAA